MIFRLFLSLIVAAVAALWFLGEPDSALVAQTNGKLSEIEKELRDMNDSVARLQSKPRSAGEKTRQEMDRTIDTLQSRIHSAQKRLQEFKSSPRTATTRDRLRRALMKIKGWLTKESE